MSESARARERLDFEAAAEVIEKGKQGSSAQLHSTQQFAEISASTNLQFTSGGLEVQSYSLLVLYGMRFSLFFNN